MESNPKNSSPKELNLDTALVQNIKGELKNLGEFELRIVTDNDLSFIWDIIDEIDDDREFSAKLIHHQLINPIISFSKFKEISDNELKELASYIIKNEVFLSDLKETNPPEFFKNFRRAINKGLKDIFKNLQDFNDLNQVVTNLDNNYQSNTNFQFKKLSINQSNLCIR